MKNIFGLTLKYIKYNFRRAVTTMIGIMLSTVIIYLIFAGAYSAYDSVAEQKYMDSMGWDAVYYCDYETAENILTLVPYYDRNPIVNNDRINISHGFYICVDSVYKQAYINDFNAMPVKYNLKYGEFPTKNGQQIMSVEYSRNLKISVGYQYDYMYTDYSVPEAQRVENHKDMTVCGIYDNIIYKKEYDDADMNNNFILDNMNYCLVTEDMCDNIENLQLYITFEKKDDIESQAKFLADIFGIDEFSVNTAAIDAFVTQNRNNAVDFLGLEAVLLIIAAFGSLCSMFIVRNAFNISVHERNNDYGILRCIGITRKQIIKVILTEAFLISTVGIFLGVVFGHGLLVAGFSFLRNQLGYSACFRASFYARALVLAVVFALVTTCYSMVAPIEKLYRLNPIESLRKRDEFKTGKFKKKRGRLFGKVFGFELEYAYKSNQRRRGHFIITTVTLMLCVIVFISISTAFKVVNRWIDENVLDEHIFDGYFEVDNYDEAMDLYGELTEGGFTSCISIYNNSHTAYIDEFDNWEDKNQYLGVYKDIMVDFEAVSDIIPKLESSGVINVIITDDYPEYELGKTYTIDYTQVDMGGNFDVSVSFYVYGIISRNELKEVSTRWGIYGKDDRTPGSTPHLIYTLGQGFDGIEGYSESFNVSGGEKIVKIDLIDIENTEKFDSFINESPYLYCDESSELLLIYDTVKTYKTIITIIILLIVIMLLSNVINTNTADAILRKGEFIFLRHIGLSRKQEKKIHLDENLIISMISTIWGCILGTVLGNVLGNWLLMLFTDEICLAVDWVNILICSVFMVVLGIISTIFSKNKD